MAKMYKIERELPQVKTRKRVAAYARVSRDTEKLLHSFSAQVSYYSELIQRNSEWEYAGVYADEGITGTSTENRTEFSRMLEDCEAGKIDIILTKSISRFARNTVDLLETIRRLKALGIEVRFEEQNINTLDGDGELMLTILASFAQEESISQSRNICWSKQKAMAAGEMTNAAVPYGYRYNPETKLPEIVPEEAAVVREIFHDYLVNDISINAICRKLNAAGIPTSRGAEWTQLVVRRMIRNETYTGNMLLGKFYSDGPLTQHHTKNHGERPMYFAEETHEAIIDAETFQKVQERFAYNTRYGRYRGGTRNCFSEKIICGCCGMPFGRGKTKREKGNKYPSWTCKKRAKDRGKCRVVTIMEADLERISAEVLGLEKFCPEAFTEQIDKVTVTEDDHLLFNFRDGRIIGRYYPRRRKLRAEGKTHG